jgi:hypothetical protein
VRAALVLALLAPLPLLAALATTLSDRLGSRLGAAAASVVDSLQAPHREPAPPTAILPLAEAEPGAEPPPVRSSPRMSSKAPARGVLVRAETVLRLAERRAAPAGVVVGAAGDRPAGIALVGVSGLGVGLMDGDILTHAAGRPAISPGEVIGAVIAARGAGASQISGRFWRRGEYYNLVVEQPYRPRGE